MTFGIPKSLKPSFSPQRWLPAGIPVMDRYIASELSMPFLFGVGAFSSLGVTIGTLFDLVRKVADLGLPMSIAFKVFLLQIPYFVSFAFPISTLLAALMVYTRMASDGELTALRSSGVSPARIVVPAVVLSLVVSGMTFWFNESIVPAAKYEASITLEKALNEEKPKFQDKNIFYQEFQDVKQPNGDNNRLLTRIFYARRFDGQQMQGLTILDFSKEGLNQIVASESATWDPRKNTWEFFNGTIYLVAPDGSYRNIVKFEKQQLQLPRTPLDLASRQRDWEEMNINQIQDYRALIQQSGDEKRVRQLDLRIQQKIAFPCVCLVLGLVGATLGIRPQRTGRGASFGISLLISFSYYFLLFICNFLALQEILSPFLGAWLPTILGLVAGSLLLVRASR